MILPEWLSHQENPDRGVDPASNGTFIKIETLDKLEKGGIDSNVRLNTMHGSEVMATQKIRGLKIEGPERTNHVVLPKAVYCRHDFQQEVRFLVLKWLRNGSIYKNLVQNYSVLGDMGFPQEMSIKDFTPRLCFISNLYFLVM